MAAPCIKICNVILRSISRTALTRYNRHAVRQMCTTNGNKNPPHSNFINQDSAQGGSGRSEFNAQGSNQGSTQQAGFSEEELRTSDEYSGEQEDEELPEETEEEFQTKQAILKASLPFVHDHGWTRNALAAGAESIGMPSIAHGMFPRGGVELVFYFYEECNKELSSILKQKVEGMKEKGEKLKTGPFIQDAVETRLKMITPYIDKWPQAMAIQTLPQNAFQAWTNLGRLMDDIWYYAGDKSNDFNWYTKRGSLAAVYKSTEIYMIQDKSEDYADTWLFLENRLEDVVKAGHLTRNLQQTGTVLSEGAMGMCIMTRNILGMNNR
ncbi:ubiquinone biosynthesis protein COQ9, mitochondrial-like [Saccostrea echinata]|uniref:ubiquinone biosynthesis protein COQ9, mitochondrial-like n=1 Tax=Saccostrea echinata TaxID=191078 RepID=UPI002A83F17A|nr:ubiquinone biosynthesis protein COQ9, mitochondrial-like [Saccostrea echinata]